MIFKKFFSIYIKMKCPWKSHLIQSFHEAPLQFKLNLTPMRHLSIKCCRIPYKIVKLQWGKWNFWSNQNQRQWNPIKKLVSLNALILEKYKTDKIKLVKLSKMCMTVISKKIKIKTNVRNNLRNLNLTSKEQK